MPTTSAPSHSHITAFSQDGLIGLCRRLCADASHTSTAWPSNSMQCSCHTSHTFVPRTRPAATSTLQLSSSFHGSHVSHSRFTGSPLQSKPIRSSGNQQRCVTSMASKCKSFNLKLHHSLTILRAHAPLGEIGKSYTLSAAVTGMIKLALQAGKANPAPPVGPALGAKVAIELIVFWVLRVLQTC